jgi:hypothetical protein
MNSAESGIVVNVAGVAVAFGVASAAAAAVVVVVAAAAVEYALAPKKHPETMAGQL